jgi:tRNA A-37 threonylcarbamoyl transferase component Bud32
MKTMHSLQIVHQDVKVRNISWSRSFQKWVFLDFGFVSSIEEKPGEKTYTFFRGTYNYTSKEMQSLYHLQK